MQLIRPSSNDLTSEKNRRARNIRTFDFTAERKSTAGQWVWLEGLVTIRNERRDELISGYPLVLVQQLCAIDLKLTVDGIWESKYPALRVSG